MWASVLPERYDLELYLFSSWVQGEPLALLKWRLASFIVTRRLGIPRNLVAALGPICCGHAVVFVQLRRYPLTSAAAGDAGAMRNLGFLYDFGQGVAQGVDRARSACFPLIEKYN